MHSSARHDPAQKAKRLNPLLGAKCFAVLCLIRGALCFVSYGRIRSFFPAAEGREHSQYYARQVARHVEGLARYVPAASCLTQALALQYILARSGHRCSIGIGVRETEPGKFAAHAWVNCNGLAVLGHRGMPLRSYEPLVELN